MSKFSGRALLAGTAALALVGSVAAVAAVAGAEGDGVRTVAGVSPGGYSGDGGPATEAQMHEPRMVTFGPDGTMYIADTFNQLIRKVDPSGTMTTLAGSYTGFVPRDEADCVPNFSGEGGPATQATLSCPHSIAVDPTGTGDVYIADSANHAIRKVDAAGVITTVAGQGGKAGHDGDGGAAVAATLQGPKGIVFDRAGNLLIADSQNDRIRRVDRPTGVITTVAGTGETGKAGDGGPAVEAQLSEPRTIALGPDGSLYIAEPKAHRVRRVDPSGVITTFAGTGTSGDSGDGGPAASARLDLPRGVAVDGAGHVYIADSMNQRIRMVGAAGTITTVAGRGKACYFSPSNTCGDGGPPLEAGFATPRAVEIDPNGVLFVTDTFNERVRRVGVVAP